MPPAKKLDPANPLAVWGAMLRYHRERAGLSQERLGELAHYSVAQISSLETARRDPPYDAVQRLDTVLATGGSLVELLSRLKSVPAGDVHPVWFRPWVNEERRALVLRKFQLVLVDGLLQTEDYACALLGGDERAVAARLERQQILSRADPPPPKLWCLLDESVLHRTVGGPEIMRAQLLHLVNSVSGRISIQVIPDGSPHPGLQGAFAIATLDEGEVAYLETAARGIVTEGREDLANLADVWETIRTFALPQRESLELIERTAEQWT